MRRSWVRLPQAAPVCSGLAEQLGGQLGDQAHVFCRDGLGEDPWLPDTVTHQFERLAAKAGVNCRLHDLRHYNATQLIAAESICVLWPAALATAAAAP